MEQNSSALPSALKTSTKQKGGDKMSTLTQERVLPSARPSLIEKNDRNSAPKIDLGKVKIVSLPRRNDEIYMRGLRRRRA